MKSQREMSNTPVSSKRHSSVLCATQRCAVKSRIHLPNLNVTQSLWIINCVKSFQRVWITSPGNLDFISSAPGRGGNFRRLGLLVTLPRYSKRHKGQNKPHYPQQHLSNASSIGDHLIVLWNKLDLDPVPWEFEHLGKIIKHLQGKK